MKPRYEVGDQVDFVNDYGVIFRDKVITGIDERDDEIRYFYAPTDAPWFSVPEKNFHPAGEYEPESFNLKLNNGASAKFIRHDDWGNKLYEIANGEQTVLACLLEGNTLYSVTHDYEEPIAPLHKDMQPAE